MRGDMLELKKQKLQTIRVVEGFAAGRHFVKPNDKIHTQYFINRDSVLSIDVVELERIAALPTPAEAAAPASADHKASERAAAETTKDLLPSSPPPIWMQVATMALLTLTMTPTWIPETKSFLYQRIR